LALPSLVRNVLAADFDNDGFEELFFNNLGEPNRLFGCRRPSAPSREDRDPDSRTRDFDLVLLDAGAAAEPDGLGTGAAVADIDGDGLLELLIAHGESAPQPLSLYKVPETGHGWLRVAPRTRFGAPARGALVRLTAGGRVQTRVIDGGSGYLCQMEPIAHFGLGRLTTVDSISVLWPDGAAVVIDHPPIRTTLTIDYPEG
jgi:hypothetical protein